MCTKQLTIIYYYISRLEPYNLFHKYMFIQIATESNFKIRVLTNLYTVFKLKIVERKYLEKITILQVATTSTPGTLVCNFQHIFTVTPINS